MRTNLKSAILIFFGLALLAGLVALTIDVVKDAFQGPGAPLLRPEAFRTEDTPFRGWSLPAVIFLVILSMAVLAFGAITLVLRNRLAALASAACLLALAGLVLFTPIGRYGLGASRQAGTAGADERFIRLESGVLYDVAGRLPFGAVPEFRGPFPGDGPQDIAPNFQRSADLRISQVPQPIPLFKVSGARSGAYLRQAAFEQYQNGVWTQDPSVVYDFGTAWASKLAIRPPSERTWPDSLDIRIIPITQMPPGEIIASAGTSVMDFPDPLLYSSVRHTFFSPNSYALAYSFRSSSQFYNAGELDWSRTPGNGRAGPEEPAISPRVRELAEGVTTGYDSPFLQLEALERYLKDNFKYARNPEPSPAGVDPVEWFLFNSRQGTALHLNTALALMARSTGIPTRLAVGWVAGKENGQQTIYSDMAHAWVEAQFSTGRGLVWLEFDVAPEGGPTDRVGGILRPTPEVRVATPTPPPNSGSVVGQGMPGTPGEGEMRGRPTADDLLGGKAPAEAGSGSGGPGEQGAAGDGPELSTIITPENVVALENGMALDTETGELTGDGPGVKGPVRLSSELLFKVRGAQGIDTLRLVVGETYDGRSWLQPPGAAEQEGFPGRELPKPELQSGMVYTGANVEIIPVLPLGPGPLPVSNHTTKVDGLADFGFRPETGGLRVEQSVISSYRLEDVSPVIRPEDVQDKKAVAPYAGLLQLPEDLPPRVSELARDLTASQEGDYGKLKAIQDYLSQNYEYDVDNAAPPPGQDAVDFFLFDDKRGTSSSFSSAFAVLARASGIPARVVSGWAISPEAGKQEVRADQAHQWAEAPFEGVGWVGFDPTPGGAGQRAANRDDHPLQPGPGTGVGDSAQPGPGTGVGDSVHPDPGTGGGDGGDGGPGSGDVLENGMTLNTATGTLGSPNAGLNPQGSTGQAGRPLDVPVWRVKGALNTKYLRQGLGVVYQGGRWSYAPDPGLLKSYVFPPDNVDGDVNLDKASAVGPTGAFYLGSPQGGTRKSVNIEAVPLFSIPANSPVPSSLYLSRISLPGDFDEIGSNFATSLRVEANGLYGWSSGVYSFDPATLASAVPASDPRYYQLPANLPQRVRDLAIDVASEAASPYEKAKALEVFLKTKYKYAFISDDPTYIPLPAGRDPVDWFLFDHPVGTCGNFSSSFVLMARSIGLPARIVTGWSIAPVAEEQVVKAIQAHQWAEVAFEGIGWITFEPTAAGGAPDRVERPVAGSPEQPAPGSTPKPPQGVPGRPKEEIAQEPAPPRITPPPLTTEETVTEVARINATRVLKGTQVLVEGTVIDSRGRPVDAMPVEIRLSETKEDKGVKMGDGRSVNGAFAIQMAIGPDIPAGQYQVLAHSLGLQVDTVRFLESWSDPPIVVYTPTSLKVRWSPDPAYAGQPVTISAVFTEQIGGQPIIGAILRLEQDGRDVSVAVTNDAGRFSSPLTFPERGIHNFRVIYGGLEFYEPITVTNDLPVWMKTRLQLLLPVRATVDQPAAISGMLLDARNRPIRGQMVTLFNGATPIGSAATDVNGLFTVPAVFATRGVHDIVARFERANFYEESQAEGRLSVYMPTRLETNLATTESARVNEIMDLEGTLTDIRGRSLEGLNLIFMENNLPLASLTTSSEGAALYRWNPASQGQRRLSVEFPGDEFFLPAKAEFLLPVYMPTSLSFAGPPSEGDVGRPIPLTVELRDVFGETIAAAELSLLENGAPISDGRTGPSGQARFTYEPYEGGNYRLTAAFDGAGFLLPSQANLDLKVFLPTALDILFPAPGSGQPAVSLTRMDVRGALADVLGRPVARQRVSVSLGGSVIDTPATTNGDGTFQAPIEPRTQGEQPLRVNFQETGFYRGSQAETSLPVFMPINLAVETPPRAFVDQAAEIRVTAQDLLGGPATEGQVSVQLDSQVIATGNIGAGGTASLELSLERRGDTTLGVQYQPAGFYRAESMSVSLPVYLVTILALDAPGAGSVGSAIEITGSLRDSRDQPLPGLEVQLRDAEDILETRSTDSQGSFAAGFTPHAFGIHALSASFAEQDFLTAAAAKHELEVYINTVISLTLPDSADAGSPTDLSIEVVDGNGSPATEGMVKMLGEGVESSLMKLRDGAAKGIVSFTRRGDISLEASFPPVGFYQGSQVSRYIRVNMPTRIELEALPEPAIYEPFAVAGRLVDFFGHGIPEKELAFTTPDASGEISTATSSDGRFTAQLEIKEPGDLTIGIQFRQEGFYHASSIEPLVKVLPVILDSSPPSVLARGRDNEIPGRVLRGDQPLPGEPVELALDGLVIGRGQADESGRVRLTVLPQREMPLGLHRLTASIPRVNFNESWEIPVKSATNIVIEAANSAHPGGHVDFTAVLLDDHESPLAAQEVTLNGGPAGRTDGIGMLAAEFKVPGELAEDRYQVSLAYAGSSAYLPSQSLVNLEITPKPPILLLTLASLAALALIGGPSTAYLVARARRRSRLRWPTGVADDYSGLLDLPASAGAGLDSPAPKIATRVGLTWNGSALDAGFQLVAGETITLQAVVLDPEDHPIVTHIFYQEGENQPALVRGKEGRISFDVGFPVKGRRVMRVIFPGSIEYLYSFAQVEVTVRAPTELRIQPEGMRLARDGRAICPMGEPLNVTLELLDFLGEGVPGTVNMRVDGQAIASIPLSGEAVSQQAPTSQYGTHELEAYFHGDDLHLPASAGLTFVVPTPTIMTLDTPPSQRPGSPVDRQQVLVWRRDEALPCFVTIRDIKGEPLSLSLLLEAGEGHRVEITSRDGVSRFPVIIREPGLHRITVSFAGDFDYLPSSAQVLVKIPKPTYLSLNLPDLRADIPRVWGVGEDLTILAALTEADGTPVDRPVQLEGPDLRVELLLSGGAGRASVNYPTPSKVEIQATFAGDEDYEESQAATSVEILNLGEEMVRMYQDFVEWADPKLPGLPVHATPRDRGVALVHVVDGITAGAGREITDLFQEADYSLHKMSLDHYARMYLASRLLGLDRRPEG